MDFWWNVFGWLTFRPTAFFGGIIFSFLNLSVVWLKILLRCNLGTELIVCSLLFQIIANYCLIWGLSFFVSSSIALCSIYVKLDFSFFVSCFINALISSSTRSIYVLTKWCVSANMQFENLVVSFLLWISPENFTFQLFISL